MQSQHEIGELGRAINGMAGRLKSVHGDLEAGHADQPGLVGERRAGVAPEIAEQVAEVAEESPILAGRLGLELLDPVPGPLELHVLDDGQHGGQEEADREEGDGDGGPAPRWPVQVHLRKGGARR